MEYTLPFPDIRGRYIAYSSMLKRGSVVAFRRVEYGDIRTGVIVMYDANKMLVAVNLYKEEGRLWTWDSLPAADEKFQLYEATKEEAMWGQRYFFLTQYAGNEEECCGKHPLIAFISQEGASGENDDRLCQGVLSQVPHMYPAEQLEGLLRMAWDAIRKESGLQYNRSTLENLCFLIGVLMISLHCQDTFSRDNQIDLMRHRWAGFSWMYSMAVGQVFGNNYSNFVQMVRAVGNLSDRKPYLHLYLPLIKGNVERICSFGMERRYKLLKAIEDMERREVVEKQNTDLDALYGILFPKHFTEAVADNRPAPTIERMKEEMAKKEARIEDLENRLSGSISDFNKRYEALLHDFTCLAEASVTFDELEKALCKLSPSNAEQVLAHLMFSLVDNARFMVVVPRLREAIEANKRPLVGHADQVILENNGKVFHT